MLLISSMFFAKQTYALPLTQTISAPDDVVVRQSGNHALIITWKKVDGAKGYEIIKARGNIGGYKKLKTVRNTSYKDKTVSLSSSGTYKVRAYRMQSGIKVYSPYSYPVSAKVCKKNDKRQNAANPELALSADTNELVLGVGESVNKKYDLEELFVTVKGAKKKGGKGRWKPLNKRVRWFSTDPSIVKVKSKWNITAGTKPGKADIYVRAHNGKRSNMIPVVVKDYAYEPVEIQYAPGNIQVQFNTCEKEIRDICSYYARHKLNIWGDDYEIRFNGEEFFTKGTLSDNTMLPTIKNVLEKSPFRVTAIRITGGTVEIIIGHYPAYEERLVFFFSRDLNTQEYYKEISPYWYYMEQLFV